MKPDISYPTGIPHDVAQLFERLTLLIHSRGFQHYSARAVLHQIRWEYQVERGDRGFKCNNNWTPILSRWVMNRHHKLRGFFFTRERSIHIHGL